MKTLILIVCCLLAELSASAQGIRFENSLTWEQVKKKAETEKKNIFIDFYTTWCIPCKAMDENVYPIKEVGDYINDKFISVKVQMDSTGKDNDQIKAWRQTARQMEKRYPITAYPTMFFVDAAGEPLLKLTGLQAAEGLLKIAALSSDPNNSYVGLYRQYLSGKRDSEFILKLISFGFALGQDDQVKEIGRDYIAKLPDADLFTKDNLTIISMVMKSVKDRGFAVFFKLGQKVVKASPEQFTPESLDLMLGSVISQELINPYFTSLNGGPDWSRITQNVKPYGKIGQKMLMQARHTDATTKMLAKFKAAGKPALQPIFDSNKTFEGVLTSIKALNVGLGEEYLVGSTVINYMNNISGNFDNFLKAATYYSQQYDFMLDAGALNSWSWIIFEQTMDKSILEKGLTWSKKSLAINPSQSNALDTYANLLYKLGHKEEAIQWEQKALATDPNNPDFNLALDRMKKDEPTWPVR